MKTLKEFQIFLLILTLSLFFLTDCISSQAMECGGTAGFEFHPPPDFESISKALEKEVLCFYSNKNRDNINVSYYGYLEGRELTKTVCDEIVESFNNSDVRAAFHASAAMTPKYANMDGVKTCYYSYEVPQPTGSSRVEYKIYQGDCPQSYAVTAIYASDSQQQDLIQKALNSFKIKACIPQQSGSLPPVAVGMSDFVLVDKSERAYTVFMAIPEEKQQEVRSKIEGKKDVFLVLWSEFSQKKDEYLLPNILKNEYQGSRVVDRDVPTIGESPRRPFGLTWRPGSSACLATPSDRLQRPRCPTCAKRMPNSRS